jgi:molybdenum cofactor guanylyltransferase
MNFCGMMVTSGADASVARPSSLEGLTLGRLLSCNGECGECGEFEYFPRMRIEEPANACAVVCPAAEQDVYHRPMDGLAADVAAFVLAGGKSTRMGADKAFVMLDGRTLLARALELARTVTDDVRIVGSAEKFAAFAPAVEDVFRECGPLGGIHAALRASVAELNLMLAVDVPFVPAALLQYLVERARGSDAIATVPLAGGGWQPLCAVYRREFGEVAEKALRGGRYKIGALFADANVQAIEEDELVRAGFGPGVFHNLNTKDDVEAARGRDAIRNDGSAEVLRFAQDDKGK